MNRDDGQDQSGTSATRAQVSRATEQHFRALADAIPQLCWMADPDGWIFWYNRRWYEYTGATPEQMAGWGWQSVHDPDELPKVMERWKASIATGKPFDMVFPLKGADGAFRPFLTRVMPEFDQSGKITGWFGTNTDITDQRTTEEALRQTSEQVTLALEAAELGAWDYRFDTGTVYWDQRARDMFGIEGDERSSYESAMSRIHSDDRPRVEQALEAALAGKDNGDYDVEFRVVWPDNSVHWVASHGRVHFVGTAAERRAVRFVGVNLDITERRLAEQKLRESREWLRVTLTSIGDAVMTADTDGRVTFLNPVASALTDWTPAEAEGQPIQTVFHIVNELTRLPADDIVARVLREGRTVALANHTALIAKSGRVTPIEDSAAPIRNAEGDIVGVVLVFHDVTEKRTAQRALQQSEERYRRLVEMSPDAILVHRNNRIEFVNPAAMAILGAATPDGVLGKSPYDIFHADYHAHVRERIEQAQFEVPTPLLEKKIVRQDDGRLIDVAVTSSSFLDDEGPAIQVIMHDITERKQKEEQQRRLHRTLHALKNSSEALLHATNEADLLKQVCAIVTEVCGHAMVWIGYAEDDENKTVRPVAYAGFEEGYLETLGITWADTERGRGPTGTAIRTGQSSICHNMLTDPAFEPWRPEALRRGYASSVVLPLINDDKTFGALTIYSREPDTFADDEIKLLGELAADLSYGITGLRLRAAHAAAQDALIRSEKLASVGRMAATIAHEINNPLAAVMNTLFLAQSLPELPGPAREYLELADAELKRISHITRQSLGFYRECSAPTTTAVAGLLESVVDLLKNKIRSKHVKLTWDSDPQLQVTAVAGELRQVFANLLANSLDAIAEGGTIKLRVAGSRCPRNGHNRVRVSIADDGRGIESAAVPRIFEAFYTTKESVGTGLGLWVSKQIIEKHGGSIRVRSSTKNPRRGTVFSIVIPVSPADAVPGCALESASC